MPHEQCKEKEMRKKRGNKERREGIRERRRGGQGEERKG